MAKPFKVNVFICLTQNFRSAEISQSISGSHILLTEVAKQPFAQNT